LKKRYLSLAVFLLLLCIALGFLLPRMSKAPSQPQFAKTLGYYPSSDSSLVINLIFLDNHNSMLTDENINGLIFKDSDVRITGREISRGAKLGDKYIYSIILHAQADAPGIHSISAVTVSYASGEIRDYPVGDISIDMLPANDAELEIMENTASASSLQNTYYYLKFKNSGSDELRIQDFIPEVLSAYVSGTDFELDGEPVEGENPAVLPGQELAMHINFSIPYSDYQCAFWAPVLRFANGSSYAFPYCQYPSSYTKEFAEAVPTN
jgi:hypothetical protein